MGMRVILTTAAGHRLVVRGGPGFRSARLYPPGTHIPGLDRIAIAPVSVEAVKNVAVVELQREALFNAIGLQEIRKGTPEFNRLMAKGVYVSDGSDISDAEVVWGIPNSAFAKAIEFAPSMMGEIFGDAQKHLDGSLKIAKKNMELWKKNGLETAEACPLIISLGKLIAFVNLLGRGKFYRSGACYYLDPDCLRHNDQVYLNWRTENVASGVV